MNAARLLPGDESMLERFFGHDQVAFERSTAGPMLDNQKLFGRLRPHGLHHSAEVPDDELLRVDQKYPSAAWPSVCDGVIVYDDRELTAQPIRETRSSGGGYDADSDQMHTTLVRYAVVSRRLMQLERTSRVSLQVLEAYYGDRGALCSEPKRDDDGKVIAQPVGRLVAVYPLTATGGRLLRASDDGKRARFHLAPMQRMENIVRQPGTQERKELLARVLREAEQLFADACSAWNALRGPR